MPRRTAISTCFRGLSNDEWQLVAEIRKHMHVADPLSEESQVRFATVDAIRDELPRVLADLNVFVDDEDISTVADDSPRLVLAEVVDEMARRVADRGERGMTTAFSRGQRNKSVDRVRLTGRLRYGVVDALGTRAGCGVGGAGCAAVADAPVGESVAHGTRRPRGHSTMSGQGQLGGSINIRERPAEANDRAVPGTSKATC
jgi:hypothetical protein